MSKFDSSRWKTLSALLDQALELDAVARTAWLDRLAAGDAGAAAVLRRMLAHAKAGPAPDDSPRNASFAGLLRDALTDEDAVDPPGQSVGAWTTRSALGSGGMGTVYLAERPLDDGVQRGALKLIRRGMDSNEILARFRRERQILMRLAHPSIAPLLDGGMTDDGRSYLVMSYIEGVRLDEWAKRNDIDLDARCNLILQLCDAVAHAHRLLIVHRDIKPSNVLVDADSRPHLLDFGIAKMLEETADAQSTATVARVFTRAYAAPEQASGENASTAVDVYQLGVLLFELLTGARFHDHPGATTGHPSQRLATARESTGDKGPVAIASRTLRGDAGIIVARATDADPSRRYASVEALAEDIRRWRSGRPIFARADSARYRAAMFARRHAVGIAAVAAIAIALIAGAGIALWQARLARAQAARAEAVNGFLEQIFRSIDPANAKGREVTAKELIDSGAARIDRDLADQPAAAAQLHATLGETYNALGDYAKAETQFRRALELFAPEQVEQTIRAQINLADVRFASGDLDEARRLVDAADERRRRDAADDDALADLILGERSGEAAKRGNAEQALAWSTQLLSRARRRFGAGAEETLNAEAVQAQRLYEIGKPAEAVAEQLAVVAGRRVQFGPDDPQVAIALHNLATYQSSTGQNEAALATHDEALRLRRKILPAGHPDIARSIAARALVLGELGRTAEAMPSWPEAAAILKAHPQPDLDVLPTALNNWGVACYTVADYACAEQRIGEALALWRTYLAPAHSYVLTAQSNLAALQLQRGDLAGAEARLREVLAARETDIAGNGTSEDKQHGVESTREVLNQALRYQRRYAEALAVARQAQADVEKFFQPPNASHVSMLGMLARSEAEMGDYPQASGHARAAIAESRQLSADGNAEEAWSQLVLALAALGDKRPADGIEPARRSIELYRRTHGERHWRTAEARGVSGMLLAASARNIDAKRELDFAIATLEKDRPFMPIVDDMRQARKRLR